MQELQRLLNIMARLRDPETGCPWDLRQDFASIAPYTIEEAYEVAEAIAADDRSALLDELGDLLLQVVFHARMAEEEGAFSFAAVATAIADKMERRHPHVFADVSYASAAEQAAAWEAIKRAERPDSEPARRSALDGVGSAMPAHLRALKLQRKAAGVGFDWPGPAPVIDKVVEEIEELQQELTTDGSAERLTEEMGDLIFACVNLARHLEIDPDIALRRANQKFERRFRAVEASLEQQGQTASSASLEELESLWQKVKQGE